MAEVNPFAKYKRSAGAVDSAPEENPFAKYSRLSVAAAAPVDQGPRSYAWSEVGPAALENAPASFGKFYGNLKEMVTSPVETGAAIHDLGANLKNFLLASYFPNAVSPEELAAADQTVNAMITGLKNRYGSEEALKRTIAEDPFGFGADISAPLTGGAGMLPKGSMAAKVVGGLGKVVDPMTLPIAGMQIGGKLAKSTGTAISNMTDPARAALMQMTGEDAPAILNALQNAQEIVPGSKPTAAQAASAAGPRASLFTSFAQSGEEVAPISKDYIQRKVDQANAKRAAIETVSGKPGELEAATAARKAQGDIDYPQAFQDKVRMTPKLGVLAADPYVAEALKNAEKLATSKGITLKDDLIEYLHHTKKEMDTMIGAEKNPGVRDQIKKKQDELVDWMKSKSPAYEKAADTYAKNSVPIAQMKVGQYLEDKLVPALMEGEDAIKLRKNDFANAMRNEATTLEKSVGFEGYKKLTDVLTPDQFKTLENIRDDLARSNLTETFAAAGKKGGALQLKDFVKVVTKDVEGPPLVKTMVSLTNNIIKRFKGQLTDKMAVELAEAMLNPETAAEALKRAMAADKRIKMTGDVISFAPKAALTVAKKTPSAAVNVLGSEENRNALSGQLPLVTVTKGIK